MATTRKPKRTMKVKTAKRIKDKIETNGLQDTTFARKFQAKRGRKSK